MHIDDAHDDNLVAEETALHAHTRAQTQAADAAKALDEPIILTTSSDDQTIDQIDPPPRAFATTTDKIAPPLPRAKIAPQPPRTFVSITDEIALFDKLANHTALAIARAFLRHSVEFILPPHYRRDVTGKMRVIGVGTKKLTKTKEVLIVKFLTPQSLKDSTMQMYCTSLEPKRGFGQGVDLSILTAKQYTLPLANLLYDIGVRLMSDADITRAMLADFDSMKGGTVFDATQVDSLDNETSERNPFRKGHNLRSVRDPIGHTRATPNPKHHGRAMRSHMRTEWIKSQGLEMQGFWSRDVFQKV